MNSSVSPAPHGIRLSSQHAHDAIRALRGHEEVAIRHRVGDQVPPSGAGAPRRAARGFGRIRTGWTIE